MQKDPATVATTNDSTGINDVNMWQSRLRAWGCRSSVVLLVLGVMRARIVLAFVLLALAPGIAAAQQIPGVITGQVRDTTGGVLPGVTVEVASPALIEKVRSVVSGNDGQYRIGDLRPGVYTVTFTLAGFGKLVREGVQLTSGFTATVNGELKVGDLAETITVSGVSPVVDVHNVTEQSVIGRTTLDVLPTGRSYSSYAKLVPGIDTTGNAGGQDVGGSLGRDAVKLISHGGTTADFRLAIDGMPQGILGGNVVPVPVADNLAEEVAVLNSALPAEAENGGVIFNTVPKTGSNAFRASFFSNVATNAMQANNLPSNLSALIPAKGGTVDYVVDVNPSVGGPIQHDRLWFFATYRDFRPVNYSTMSYDLNPSAYVFTADTSRDPALNAKPQKSFDSRITWQATPRNRISASLELATITQENFFVGAQGAAAGALIYAPEATSNLSFNQKPVAAVSWTAPVSNRTLIEVGGQVFKGHYGGEPQRGLSVPGPSVVETTTNIVFRSVQPNSSTAYSNNPFSHEFLRGAVSYTNGGHAIKVGGTLWYGRSVSATGDTQGFPPYSFRLVNGVPNAVVYYVDPNYAESRYLKGAIFAQDQWTVRRLTVNAGLRIDTIDSGYPAQPEAANAYFGARDFAAASVISWRDWSPRIGVAYDLFGNGKTAVKGSISRYVNWASTELAAAVNPATTSGAALQRSWSDTNHDSIPQGDPTNAAPNGELTGPSPNATWGTPKLPSRYDPAWANGWGKRDYNWEYTASVQQELRSNVSLTAGYFYRVFKNFSITDNAATVASDYDKFCITGPSDPRLPGGGGPQICAYDIKPAFASAVDNVTTLASNFGDIYQNFKGVDAAVNLRLSKTLLQGGVSSGREVYDFCGVVAAVPEILISGSTKIPVDQCHQQQPFLTQVKFLGSYQLPWGLNAAASYQNSYNTTSVAPNILSGMPRMGLQAQWVATNGLIAPALGRNLASGVNGTATINVVTPGTLWGDRVQQLDLRLTRTFKTGRASTKVMVDVYNLTNSSTITSFNNAFGTTGAAWLTPLAIIPARLLKLGVQLDF